MASVRVLFSSIPALQSSKQRCLDKTSDVALDELEISDENAVSIDMKSTREDTSSSSDSTAIKTAQSSIQCAECGQQFMFATKLVAHSRKTQHRPFACQYKGCKKCYTKREHLTRHVETVHVCGTNPSLKEGKRFKCELCKARFTYNHGLTRHMKRSHWNVKLPFECLECLKGFKKKSELQAHSYVHTGVLPFECQECGERFLKRFWLTRHQRKHDANKRAEAQVYVCDCGEICFDEDELKSHKQVEHSSEDREDIVDGGERPKKEVPAYMCLVCDQTFSRKQYLRAHLRTHFESLDDRKQYTCPMDGCDKAYTRSSNLMTHYNAVHDKHKSKRFACPREDCTARFGYKTVLKHHIESIHDNPKPPKRRERKSVGILERVLGVSQFGEQEPQVAIVVEECLSGAMH